MPCKDNKFSIVAYKANNKEDFVEVLTKNMESLLVCDNLLDDLKRKNFKKIDKNYKIWMIECQKNPEIKLGVLVLQKISDRHKSAELILTFTDSELYSNPKLITKILKLLNEEFFNVMDFVRLQGIVLENNLKLRQAYKDAGFVEEGLMRSKFKVREKRYDAYVMSMLKVEWTRSQK